MTIEKKQNKPEEKKRFQAGAKRNSGPRNYSNQEREVPEWNPKTDLGKKVKSGEITDLDDIFDSGEIIFESEVVDLLLPDLEEDLLLIGQAKGKFGGGQRRIFRQTQKKTREGNKIKFTTCAVVGNKNGYVGVGIGKSKETVPARDKAKRRARLNLMRIRRGCGTWASDAREANSIPFAVEGKCGSVKIKLMPAPKGKGLCVEKECAKILTLAGIKDIWSKTQGQTKTKLNLIYALVDALKKLSEIKIKPEDVAKLGIVEGRMKEEPREEIEEVIEVTEPVKEVAGVEE
ncbi:MAG: 30S ribosomal protein S5 [Nanoarchaeota archaeon]|nr:30S ribosomal protein S5 [Nanoarchaeota archaeon]MBU1622651.1 30S ribosomal protein S5 [Nanoarchaeota archaeon]MBU1974234.1 30S ribosomal protein S5 [Nanoarchaeota archaeon]